VGSLLEVGTGFHPELSGRDNVYLYGAILGMRRGEVARRFDEIVAFAELERFMDTPVKRYSSGMYLRLAFAVAAHLETETLLVDEALAVGDAAFQSKCLGRMGSMASGGRTVLFVSHNMAAVQHLCRRAIVLARGAVAFDGPAGAGIEFYQRDVLADAGADGRPAHVLFETAPPARGEAFAITRVELLDAAGAPKPVVCTWDAVTVRITGHAPRRVRSGSAVLEIRTPLDVPLLLTSTQPDSTLALDIPAGVFSVECQFDALPLSAGDYRINAGLAVPNKEWLCWSERLGVLHVQPRDVYGSGLAPAASRSLVATPHRWRAA
jgi:lipopolysaccharide transport system ATP-binding protein